MAMIYVIAFLIFPLFINAQVTKSVISIEAYILLNSMDNQSFVIIDGRDSLKYKSGHIKNAINIDAFAPTAEMMLSKVMDNETIFIYCTLNNRSKKLVELLNKSQYKGEITKITDGITGWKENGYNVVSQPALIEENTNQTDTISK